MPRATILLVDADSDLREAVVQVLATIPRVRLRGCNAAALPGLLEQGKSAAVLLADPAGRPRSLPEPEPPLAVVGRDASRARQLEVMRHGISRYFALPEMAEALAQWLRPLLQGRPTLEAPPMVAHSVAMQALDRLVSRIAPHPATVFITGESGVGKEVLARQLHVRSPRASGPFVAINCAAVPETMLEAMLFGHARGAFTGAVESRPGKFLRAHGGTLLLDEVTEIPVHLQAKLLRVLQEREVEPLGGGQAQTVDVRVLASSNRDLREALAAGVLREDLYYRLNVFPVCIPPLRERPEDVVPLARTLLRRLSGGRLQELDNAARRRLRGHDWPGNVRELGNVMERAAALHEGPGSVVTLESLWLDSDMLAPWPAEPAGSAPNPVTEPTASEMDANSTPLLEQTLQTQEGRVILNVLREAGGRRKEAADRLGISPRTLRYKLARLREHGFAVPASG